MIPCVVRAAGRAGTTASAIVAARAKVSSAIDLVHVSPDSNAESCVFESNSCRRCGYSRYVGDVGCLRPQFTRRLLENRASCDNSPPLHRLDDARSPSNRRVATQAALGKPGISSPVRPAAAPRVAVQLPEPAAIARWDCDWICPVATPSITAAARNPLAESRRRGHHRHAQPTLTSSAASTVNPCCALRPSDSDRPPPDR